MDTQSCTRAPLVAYAVSTGYWGIHIPWKKTMQETNKALKYLNKFFKRLHIKWFESTDMLAH